MLFQSLLCLFIAWIYLQVYFLGITSFWRRRHDEGDEKGPSMSDILVHRSA